VVKVRVGDKNAAYTALARHLAGGHVAREQDGIVPFNIRKNHFVIFIFYLFHAHSEKPQPSCQLNEHRVCYQLLLLGFLHNIYSFLNQI
jgi:hypothetical protein